MGQLPGSLGRLTDLRELSVNLGKSTSFPEGFTGLSSLEVFTQEGYLDSLPHGFSALALLQCVTLRGIASLPEDFGGLDSLRYFYGHSFNNY